MQLWSRPPASLPHPRMSPSRTRSWLTASRHRLALLVLVVGLSSAVAVHHGDPMAMHTSGGVCLAVFAGAMVLASSRSSSGVRLRRPRPVRLRPTSFALPVQPEPRARAGPIRLQVMRL